MDNLVCYKSGKIVQCELARIPDIKKELYLEKACLQYYVKMKEDAKKEGVVFEEDTAWRSMEHQTRLYTEWKAGILKAAACALPGYSNHQNGVCVDLDTQQKGKQSKVYQWLNKNGAKYYFFNTVPSEPWHWEFVMPKEMKQ
jgi:LAS superfamily LD-carboxypeptidase LdcB